MIICVIVISCYAVSLIISVVLDFKVDPKYQAATERLTSEGGWRRMWDAIRGNHLWISTVFRPTRGTNYSRPQRVTSLFAFILGTIMFNAIFYSTYFGAQDMVANGFISALLGLVVPNILGWLFSHIGLERTKTPPVAAIASRAYYAADDDFEMEEYGHGVTYEPKRGASMSASSANLSEQAQKQLAEQAETPRRKGSAAIVKPKPKPKLEPPVIEKKSLVAGRVEARRVMRAERANSRRDSREDALRYNTIMPLQLRYNQMVETCNDKMDALFDTIELGLDRVNCMYRTVSVGMVIASIVGIVLYYVCCVAIIIPLVLRMNHVWPMYLTDLFFYLATIYLIIAIEIMYFEHKRAHWNEWAEWHVSKIVMVAYMLAIIIVLGLSLALITAGAASQIWRIPDGLGHIITTFCGGVVLVGVLATHLILYVGMKPDELFGKERTKFENIFELPRWSNYFVYAFAFAYMLAAVGVTIALGYTRLTDSISVTWIYSNLIAMAFDILVIRVVGVVALGFFAPKLSEFIKAAFFTSSMTVVKVKREKPVETPATPAVVHDPNQRLTLTDAIESLSV
jgi:hypothetical protein